MRFFQKCKCHVCYRVKLKMVFLCVAVAGVLFLLHQMLLLQQQLENVREASKDGTKYEKFPSQMHTIRNETQVLVRGIHYKDRNKYRANPRGKFVCIMSNNEIDFSKVNDDYCDCPEDGSDEPGTNACQNGKFVCLTRGSNIGFPDTVPSSRVNDGICDCCDGSDEWRIVSLPSRLKDSIQQKLGRYQQPCPNLCKVQHKIGLPPKE